MASSTIACRLILAITDYDIRSVRLSIGASTDLICRLPSNQSSEFSVISINLLSTPASTVPCIAYSYIHTNIRCLCPAVQSTHHGQIKCYAYIYSETHVGLCTAHIGAILYADVACILYNHIADDRHCMSRGADIEGSSIIVQVNVATQTDVNSIPIAIGYSGNDDIGCTVTGEAYTQILCSIITNTYESTLWTGLHGVVDIDAGTTLACMAYIRSGDPIDYVAVEVVLGDRFISSLKCQAVIPKSPYSDLSCSTSPILDGEPRWNRFTTTDSVIVRLMNIGSEKVIKAILQNSNKSTDTSNIEQFGSVWQIGFNKPVDKISYIIVITLSSGKVVVVDKSRSNFAI